MKQSDTVEHIDEYGYLDEVAGHFAMVTTGATHLFTTDAEGLFEAYLAGFPAETRQHYNCNACRRFIEAYGSLVVITSDGETHSPFWSLGTTDTTYHKPFANMAKIVDKARVTGVFLTSEKVWGVPKNHDGKRHIDWHHLHVVPSANLVYRAGALTAFQAAAEKTQDYQTVSRALAEFDLKTLGAVVSLLESDALYRSEKVLGPAVWLRDRQSERQSTKNSRVKANLLWRAIAQAPAGFCHPRSSMIGTLLDDIASGMAFDDVSARFKAKMHPLKYQRPQAAPAAGAIAQAEKLFEQLGLASALRRRFARLDEVDAIWRPAAPDTKATGTVFGHLKAKDAAPDLSLKVPARNITWLKFQRDVLPEAKRLDVYCPARAGYRVLVTAVDPEAKPILQWDSEEKRNPFSSYVWNSGSNASQHRITPGYNPVAAITLKPHQWYGRADMSHQSEGLLFLVDGATETVSAGLAMFPENLRSDLHSVRSVIEAHSRSGELEGLHQASAVGVGFDKGRDASVKVRVTNAHGMLSEYVIDRWE